MAEDVSMAQIRAALARIDGRLGAVDKRLDSGFARLTKSLDGMGGRIDGMGARLGASLDGVQAEIRSLRTWMFVFHGSVVAAALMVMFDAVLFD